jgi:phospholipid/cholesterol/gamma-HCH transport system substrate-binding protein
MKEQRKTEIKVGLTVIIGLIIFLWIFSWAKNLSIKSTENLVKIKFNNISGLEIGDPVTINGFRKGYVKNILINNNELIVEAAIDNDVILKEDSKFSIVMLDLMGGKKIEINPGISDVILNLNNIHNGIFQADIPSVMALLGSVQDDLVFVLKDVKVALNSLNKFATDDKFTTELKKVVENLNNLTLQTNELILQNKFNISKLTQSAIELSENANNLILDNKDEFNQLLTNFNNLSKQTSELLNKINKFTDEVNNKENNLGKILYDDQLIENLKNSINQLETLSKILIEQLNAKGIKVDAHIF